MDFGFVRVAAAVPLVNVADCPYNALQTIALLEEAEQKDVQVVCFPELGLTGYTCADLFHQQRLLDAAEQALLQIVQRSATLQILSLVGMPLRVGNRLVNVAVAIQGGKILAVIPKTWLPNYDEFYEKRWFVSACDVQNTHVELGGHVVPFGTNILLTSGNVRIGVELCEDLWMPIPPSSSHALNGANILCNLSASNDLVSKDGYRKRLIEQQSARCLAAYVYASSGFGESTTDLVFGGTADIVENGKRLETSTRFSLKEQLIVADVDIDRLNQDRLRHTGFDAPKSTGLDYRLIPFERKPLPSTDIQRTFEPRPFVPTGSELDERCRELFSIQSNGLAKRIAHIGCKQVVVGISGGLDSTLALLVAVKTFDLLGLPRKQIVGITMPGFGTTNRTYQNALQMMEKLGVEIREISIRKAVQQHFSDIRHHPDQHDVTYENAQARERTQILMDVANQVNGLVIGTGDLSELALGWATYNGDHMSMYAVNVGVPKTLVRFMVDWVAKNEVDAATAKILQDVIETPVSPELLPVGEDGQIQQKTEDLVGPYELHDFFLYYLLRFGFRPQKIYWMATRAFDGLFAPETILKWLRVFYRRFFLQQFKRSCLPDGPKVGSVSLSPRGDWRMPSDASARVWLEEVDAISMK